MSEEHAMSKRYYLTKVIGNGDDTERDEYGFIDDALGPYRLSINNPQYVPLWKRVGTIQVGADGVPLAPYQFCTVDAADHSSLRADPLLIALPDGPLDMKFDSFSPPVKAVVRDFINMLRNRYGMSISTSIIDGSGGTTVSYRDVLQYIGKKLDASFDIKPFEAE